MAAGKSLLLLHCITCELHHIRNHSLGSPPPWHAQWASHSVLRLRQGHWVSKDSCSMLQAGRTEQEGAHPTTLL